MEVLYLTLEAEIGNPGAEKNFHPSRRKFFFFKSTILLFRNVCKQTFHISHVRISQKVKGVLTSNFQHIIFI